MQCLSQFATNIAWVFLITWLPTYLIQVYSVDVEQAGLLASIPLLFGTIGCALGGVATDRLTRRLGIKWGRNLLGMITKFIAAAGLVAALAAPDPLLATIALAGVSFAVDMGLGATWAYFQDAGGPYVGTLLGWANMFGNFGSGGSARCCWAGWRNRRILVGRGPLPSAGCYRLCRVFAGLASTAGCRLCRPWKMHLSPFSREPRASAVPTRSPEARG